MKINNLKIRKKATALALAGVLATSSLTGCVKNKEEKEEYPIVAVIFDENTATIIECDNYWFGAYSEGIEIIEKNGGKIYTSREDTKLFKNMSYEEIEKLIIDMKGEDVVINYYNSEKPYTKKKEQ